MTHTNQSNALTLAKRPRNNTSQPAPDLVAAVLVEDQDEESHTDDDRDQYAGVGEGVPGLSAGVVGGLVKWRVQAGKEQVPDVNTSSLSASMENDI